MEEWKLAMAYVSGAELKKTNHSSVPTKEIMREVIHELEALGDRRRSNDTDQVIAKTIRQISRQLLPLDLGEPKIQHEATREWNHDEDPNEPSELGANASRELTAAPDENTVVLSEDMDDLVTHEGDTEMCE
ncbi:hypothetical protein R1sor_009729 [Riccia sorocarpa]|uniref:Uncharacterized protein n=1 Tax=Riccia sorocarpa TaxID=122646 RepID=A0ABD3HW26_9MARC